MLRVLDLFSGIGGFSLGLERTGGFQTVAFCEIEPFCRRVLAKHWPEVPCYDDVRTLTADRLRADGIGVDVICGGFPCQDVSSIGKQAGLAGDRSGLWTHIARLACDLRPLYVVVENVGALLSGAGGAWFGRVLGELAEIGYDAEWHCIPAAAVGAHHRRDRVWVVAHPARVQPGRPLQWSERERIGASGQSLNPAMADADSFAPVGSAIARQECDPWLAEPDVGRVAHGVPNRVERLRALGNAVVPQVVELIGRAILEARAA